MSINIGDENALESIAKIEGEKWRLYQYEIADNPCSFFAFQRTWEEQYSHNKPLMEKSADFQIFISVNSNAAIYGLGGWRRYSVRADGMIFFLKDFASKEATKKALEIGFDIK